MYTSSENGDLKIIIERNGSFSGFKSIMIFMTALGSITVLYFIYTSLTTGPINSIRIIFAILGTLGFLSFLRQLRDIILLTKGNDEIMVNDRTINHSRRLGILSRSTRFELSKIKKIKLHKLDEDPISSSYKMFNMMREGMIIIEISKRRKITFGETLTLKELTQLTEEIKDRIGPSIAGDEF